MEIAVEPLIKTKTEKIIRELLAKLLKNRNIEAKVISDEVLPQFEALLRLVTDQPTHSDGWLEKLQKQAEKFFKVYSE